MESKSRQKLLVIGAIAAVVLFAGDKLLLTPLLHAWDARAARIKVLRNQLSRGKMLVQREPGIRNHWDEMQKRALTNNTSAAEQQVFRAIDSWAQDTGVIVNAITPQWKHDSDEYATYECRVDASGNLSRLSRFLYRIEREPLALRLDSVELSARDKDGQQLSLGLQFSGLMLNPEPK
jgi:Tfp pilus assembly protein PilO